MGFCGTPAHPTAPLTVRGGLWPLTGGCWQAGMLGPARVGVGVSAGGLPRPHCFSSPLPRVASGPREGGRRLGRSSLESLPTWVLPGGPREAALSPSP